jgi:hypothetical protein
MNIEISKMTWSKKELNRIAESDDLHISPFRDDGKTYGTPTWIWSVVVGDSLYVRPYNGKKSTWFQAALKQKAGRISAAGMTKEVIFEAVDGAINKEIDEAYRTKYKDSPYVNAMVSERAASTTIKITPSDGVENKELDQLKDQLSVHRQKL